METASSARPASALPLAIELNVVGCLEPRVAAFADRRVRLPGGRIVLDEEAHAASA